MDDKSTPVSSDGSALDAAVFDRIAESDGTMVPGTAPSVAPHETGASFDDEKATAADGGFGTHTVIGDDSRTRTTPTTWHPASATVQLTMLNDAGNRVFFCSGFMISADTLVTAGHCVYGDDGWITGRSFIAYPGRDGGDSPYGGCAAVSFHSVKGWTEDQDFEYDYGAVKLNCDVGLSTGTYGYYWQSASLDGTGVVTRGYPGDKANGTQWVAYDQVRVTEDLTVYHQADNVPGNSGNPLYTYRDSCNGPCVLAVDNYGCPNQTCTDDDPPYTNHNSGTRVTEEVFDNFQYWAAL